MRAAFATLEFPISDIEIFHVEHGSEFDNAKIDEVLDVFEVERSLSRKRAVRQRRRRVNEQDTEGGVRLPRGIRNDRKAADEAGGLRALTQQSQATFDCAIHDPGRVQEGKINLLKIVQESVANPRASRALEANPYQQHHRAPKQGNQKEDPRRRNFPQREVGFDVGGIPPEVRRRQRMGSPALPGRVASQGIAIPAAGRICANY